MPFHIPIFSPKSCSLSKSLIAYLASVTLLLAGGLIYYPKWKLDRTEATLSWDVSGYYYYLPAFLIYHDAKQLAWHDDILQRYYPAPGDQAFEHRSGNMVMKYSMGMALQYLPFFLIADLVSPVSGFPSDGFSRPYQLAVSLGSLLIACLGLWLLRIALRRHFPDGTVAVALITIAFATNYLDYASINHAMTHNYLFTWYAVLILLSEVYWKRKTIGIAVAIGLVCGLMALTRPSEVIAILLPFLWGVGGETAMHERMKYFRRNWSHLCIAALSFLAVGILQTMYWKYVTGEWIVYSYQDQGFSWLSPHFMNGLFSYRAGWLVYTPVMLASLVGCVYLWKKSKALFYPLLAVSLLFMYVTWSWDIWWYGGSLGQRAMVQLYPVLAFPLAACIEHFQKSRRLAIGGVIFLVVCMYYNLWLTHQAHRGGLFRAGEMTKAYFWKILGKYQVEEEAQFRLDLDEWYRGSSTSETILQENFESGSSLFTCPLPALQGSGSVCVGPQNEFSIQIPFEIPKQSKWLRATATFGCAQKEWDVWKMAQFRLHLMRNAEVIKTSVIRVHRALHDGETQRFSIDLYIPDLVNYTGGMVDLWSAGSDKYTLMDNLTVEAFTR
jgi:hypothetical protein